MEVRRYNHIWLRTTLVFSHMLWDVAIIKYASLASLNFWVQALLEKGISQEDTNKTTCHVFEDEDLSEDGHNMHFGMSKLNLDRLFEQASKQWLRSREKTLNNRKSSVVRWLQYRGFGWGVTKFILKKLETEHPAWRSSWFYGATCI